MKYHMQEIDLIHITKEKYLEYVKEAEILGKEYVRALEWQKKRQTQNEYTEN